jgi:hypothetical protein
MKDLAMLRTCNYIYAHRLYYETELWYFYLIQIYFYVRIYNLYTMVLPLYIHRILAKRLLLEILGMSDSNHLMVV